MSESGEAAPVAQRLRAWRACSDLPGQRGAAGPAGGVGCNSEAVAGRGTALWVAYEPSWFLRGVPEAVIFGSFCFPSAWCFSPPLPSFESDFLLVFLLKKLSSLLLYI